MNSSFLTAGTLSVPQLIASIQLRRWQMVYTDRRKALGIINSSRNSVIGIVSTLWAGQLRRRRSIPGRGKKYLSSQPRLNRFCDTPSLYTMGIEESFSGYKAGRGVKLTVHLRRQKRMELYLRPPPSPQPSWRTQGQFYLYHLIFVYERCTADSYTNDSLSKHRHTTRISSRTSDGMKVTSHNVQCVLVGQLSTLRKICGTPTRRC